MSPEISFPGAPPGGLAASSSLAVQQEPSRDTPRKSVPGGHRSRLWRGRCRRTLLVKHLLRDLSVYVLSCDFHGNPAKEALIPRVCKQGSCVSEGGPGSQAATDCRDQLQRGHSQAPDGEDATQSPPHKVELVISLSAESKPGCAPWAASGARCRASLQCPSSPALN